MREPILFVIVKILVTTTLFYHQPSQGKVIYISPSHSCLVQSNSCHSLNQLATNTSGFGPNTTLILLPGVHTLSVEFSISSNISYLSLLTASSSERSTSVVICQRKAGFNFHDITHISLHGLKLLGCKCNIISVQHLSIKNSTFQGKKDSESALEINATNANITNGIFIFNRIGRCLSINFEVNFTFPTLVGGAILAKQCSNITIVESRFESNVAEVGGAIFANTGSNIQIFNSSFIDNYVTVANITIQDSHCSSPEIAKLSRSSLFQTFAMDSIQSNSTRFNVRFSMGGAITLFQSTLLVNGCVFSNNTSKIDGAGVLAVNNDSVVNIYNSEFLNSPVGTFGGFSTIFEHSYVTINNCTIYNCSAQQGGVFFICCESYLTIKNSVLINNTASGPGGVIVSDDNCHVNISSSQFFDNEAESGGMFLAANTVLSIKGNNTIFSRNKAKIFGGVVKIFRGTLILNGDCTFADNQAIAGGAVYTEESTLNFNGKITFKSNVAKTSGGGLYLYHSRLYCNYKSTLNVLGNRANLMGGGIYAANSFITVSYNRYTRVGSFVHFVDNVAQTGGGIYLESASQLRIYKTGDVVTSIDHNNETRPVSFDSNSADFGSAIYVRDKTYFDVCSRSVHSDIASDTSTECFVQVLSSHATYNHKYKLISIDFAKTNHSQTVESTIIYGGLLDRCTLNPHAEVRVKHIGHVVYVYGVTYLKLISNLNDTSRIASAAVRLCFCAPPENKPNCSYAPPQVNVTKGKLFNISLVAVDQVNHTIENVMVYSSLSSPESGLGYGQLAQKTTNACTNLNFSISSPHSYEQLILYAEGPCRNASRSQSKLSIVFKPCICPKIGFQPKDNDSETVTCECKCDSRLHPYITNNECNYETGMLTRKGNFWITYVDYPTRTLSGFVVYSHCPLDYCLPNVPVNLNLFNGSDDSQCAYNRSGMLCGACQSHLSLSFGSSLCIQCSTVWYKTFPALLIITLVVGIALVCLLLALNLTVAIGNLNGLIFYVNILGANGSTIITSSVKVPSLFISWLNLEVGFDICFFEGMDTYWKTWLQLAFPSYVILLVIIIIIVSNHSIKFSQLLAKRNPVATLATLILFSYTMFLRTMIAVLSFAKLNYPDGSHRWVWLHDGTVDYLRGKHIALSIVAILILIFSVIYTSLLFFWPWLLHHQNKAVFRCIRSQKLHHFMAPYHAPYNVNHRYWTGLLLFVRVVLYLVFTLNASNDPGVNLLAIAVLVGAVLFLRARVGRIYQNSVIDWIETICYSNAILFSSVQLYLLKAGSKEAIDVISYVSGVIIMILFLTIILHHMWRECGAKYVKMCKQRMVPERNLIFDGDDESLAAYPPVNNTKATPTFTVVERPTDCDTLQASNADQQIQRSNSSLSYSN